MPRENNFLLGSGERLTTHVKVPHGGGAKNPPYSFERAVERTRARLASVTTMLDSLPASACPKGEAVAALTLHPRYIAKSDYPVQLLQAAGLRCVGSKARRLQPEEWGIQEHPEGLVSTEDLFVAGTRENFHRWANSLDSWKPDEKQSEQLQYIEDIRSVAASEKVFAMPQDKTQLLAEVVLHNSFDPSLLGLFLQFANTVSGVPLVERIKTIGGLSFVPVQIDKAKIEELAMFSFVRAARGMPTLRPVAPDLLRNVEDKLVGLPTSKPVAGGLKALIFDGGIPERMRKHLEPWVRLIEPDGISKAVPELEDHGLAVTSSLLFGPLGSDGKAQAPITHIDHVRVLDDKLDVDPAMEYLDVLDRIEKFLLNYGQQYSLVNLSVSPRRPVEDDDVTRWTATLDTHFSKGQAIVTVAAGNDGELDAASSLNRVQVPGDAVNVLSVGAANSQGKTWQRAPYSSVGPGRCPGVIKPDVVAFGGHTGEMFRVLSSNMKIATTSGTSFAAPFALRCAATLLGQMSGSLSPLAVRALLIHRAQRDGQPQTEVGWGRVLSEPELLITCRDTEATVLYQGWLPISEHLRAPLPLPDGPLKGLIEITGTLLISPEVDPENPGAYTRAGMQPVFRPNASRKVYDKKRKKWSEHAESEEFFAPNRLYAPEIKLREEGHKWEPCLHASKRKQGKVLKAPVFDIYYHNRKAGRAVATPEPIPYALVITLSAKDVPDFYSRVVRTYAKTLVQIQPKFRVQLRASA